MLLLELMSGELSWNEKKLTRLARSEVLILAFFMENDGVVLSQDKLLSIGWPDSIVAPNSLVGAIKNIRKSLSIIDSGIFIETVHRRGYIFHLGSEHCKVVNVTAEKNEIQDEQIAEVVVSGSPNEDGNRTVNILPASDISNSNIIKINSIYSQQLKSIVRRVRGTMFYICMLLLVIIGIFIESHKSTLFCYQVNNARVCGIFSLKENELKNISNNIGAAHGEFLYGYEKNLSEIKLYKVK